LPLSGSGAGGAEWSLLISMSVSFNPPGLSMMRKRPQYQLELDFTRVS
jgi:hypothetical protein